MLRKFRRAKFKLKNLIINPNKIAIEKLAMGPAKATFKFPHLLSLKLLGLIGTGFAHPIIGPLPEVIKNKSKGSKTEPMGSRCSMGLIVNLPAFFAVSSPKERAMLP
ncbi:MAG: hypothetical protein ABH967_00425 [Patescibacteria group bacterium]